MFRPHDRAHAPDHHPVSRAPDRLDEARRLLAARAFREAHALCLEVLAQDPDAAEAYFLLGVLSAEHGVAGKAAELFEQAVALDATASYHAHLARALVALNRPVEAREAAERAMALAPTDALTLDTIGVALSRTGAHDRAVELFRRAAAREGAGAGLWYNLGAAEQFVGDFTAAEAAYRRAVALDPRAYKALAALVGLSRQTPERNLIAELEALFPKDDAEADAHPDRALQIGHALAKSSEDMGDDLAALDWLVRAKAPKRRAVGYDAGRDEAAFAAAARTTAPPPGPEAPCESEAPIFVVGLPRTGTTLVERILSSHPDVTSVGELTAFALLVKQGARTPANTVLDAETLDAARALDLSGLGQAYVDSTRPLGGATARFVDKMPLNVFYAGLILRALPGARVLCLRRGPLDSIVSNFRQLFATDYPYYRYALGLEDAARYYVMFDRLVGQWRETLPANRFTEVSYEALVRNQEAETRRILAFCGLDWDDRCLAFHENAAAVATASSVQVRRPIYASSIGRWRRWGERLAPAVRILEEAGIQIS